MQYSAVYVKQHNKALSLSVYVCVCACVCVARCSNLHFCFSIAEEIILVFHPPVLLHAAALQSDM